MNQKITIDICTKGRYFSTLPLTIQSVLNQTVLPTEIIIYDDNSENEKIDLRSIAIYQYFFKLMEMKKIEWVVIYGKSNPDDHQPVMTSTNDSLKNAINAKTKSAILYKSKIPTSHIMFPITSAILGE